MAYNQELAERIRKILKGKRGVEERKMFGGLTFMVNGHMACGIEKNRLMVRVKKEQYEELLKKPHAKEMDLTGKPLRGFLFIQPKGFETDAGLGYWIAQALIFAKTLPKKDKIPRKKQK